MQKDNSLSFCISKENIGDIVEKINVLVVSPFEEKHQKRLDSDPRLAVIYRDRKQCENEAVTKADIIIGNPVKEQMKYAKNLKVLQLGSAGSDGFTEEGVLPSGCILCNASGAYGLALSEHMVAMTLMLMKKYPYYLKKQMQHQWAKGSKIKSIYGSVFLIVGLGDIGSEFAKRVKAMGAYTIGIRRHVSNQLPDYLDELHPMSDLKQLLKRADVVTLSLPSTAETVHMFDWECFQSMKKEAYLINVGRGDVMKGQDLLKALEENEIAGAAIDVYEKEPMPEEDALWDQDNLIITPHIAGGYWLSETFDRFVEIALDNIDRYAQGKELRNVVDFKSGYRKYSKEG